MSAPLFLYALLAPAHALDIATQATDAQATDAQDTDAPRTPTAAIVLGFTPEDIQLPGTPIDAVGSVGTAVGDANGIPDSFALELMPYWLGTKAGRNLDLRKYVNGGGQSLAQNFGVSIAVDQTTSVAGDEDTEDLRAALGVRTTFWGKPAASTAQGRFAASWDRLFVPGTPAPAIAPKIKEDACALSLQQLGGFAAWLNAKIAAELAETQSKNLARLDEKQGQALALCNTVNAALLPKSGKACVDAGFLPAGGSPSASDDPATLETLRGILREMNEAEGKVGGDLNAAVKKQIKELADEPASAEGELAAYLDAVGFDDAFDECGALLERREGFVLEVAGGMGLLSIDKTLTTTGPADWSAWVAPGWVADKWSVTALARLRGSALYATPELHLDAGAGFGYQWPVVTIGLQGLYGIPLQGDSPTAKVLLTDDIHIGGGVWFSSALGASLPPDEPGSFLSFLSIKFAANKESTLQTPGPAEMSALLVDE